MAKVIIKKPLHGPGGPVQDSNFDPILFSEAEAKRFAKAELKKSKRDGCKRVGLRDCGEYWRYSIC